MLNRKLIIVGILIVGISTVFLLNNPLEIDNPVANKEAQEPLFTKEELHKLHLPILKRVTEKLHKKYLEVDVKTTSKKELVLQVVGDEEYFNSVKSDMESIVNSVIKTSILKDYTVVFERWEFSSVTDENNDIHEDFQR